jgi:predicted heme/steroid binding protein
VNKVASRLDNVPHHQRILVTIASAVIGLAAIGAALVHVNRGPTSAVEPPSAGGKPAAVVSREELARNDGRNGNKCYVAVDGNVYVIEGRPLWADGRHVPSGGRAMCGQDLSGVIDQSPHGRSKLQQLTVVGTLAP